MIWLVLPVTCVLRLEERTPDSDSEITGVLIVPFRGQNL